MVSLAHKLKKKRSETLDKQRLKQQRWHNPLDFTAAIKAGREKR
jgi:hypothetical protein